MNLEEAYENIKVTEEEEKSIRKYLGFNHSAINILSDFTAYNYCNVAREGWHLPETEEEFKANIENFVNIYSVMCKERNQGELPINLIRGTSTDYFQKIGGETKRFLSTTTKQEIAKRFCKYQDSAIVDIIVKDDVPFLYAENYRPDNNVSESEYIIAPFCKVDKKQMISGNKNSYTYYDLVLSKPCLEEKSNDELSDLYDKLVKGFQQNVKDMKEEIDAIETIISIQEITRVSTREIASRISELHEKASALTTKTQEFSSNLESLLKGLCRQKELEIDKPMEIIEEDRRQKQMKAEEEKRENERLEKVNGLSSKLSHTPSKVDKLFSTISTTYEQLINNENAGKIISRKLGVNLGRTLNKVSLDEKIGKIKENLETIKQKCESSGITFESSLEDVLKTSDEMTPLFDGVTYSLELVRNFSDIGNSHKFQIDNDIKRSLYEKVYNIIRKSRIEKYTQEYEDVSEEKVGFFGRIMGKDILKEEKLANINLKIKLEQTSIPETKTKYSVQDMLAEIYAAAISEFEGQFSPEMAEIFSIIKSTYGAKNTQPFSDEHISNLAMEKIAAKEKSNLPIEQNRKRRLFGKTKEEIERLKAENSKLQIKVEESLYNANKWATQNNGQNRDYTSFFENQLNGVLVSTKDPKERAEENLDKTRYLWEQ